ncbi:MAG TPA: transporter substrate-binding domain-containing protein [Actinomycetota bacterium]|nr:transporter substrate-binding domain-containing protein [Actinomycetota bacterium]
MRSRLIGIVAVLAVFGLIAAACGEEETPGGGGGGGESPTPAFTTLKEGVLTVGSCLDYKPFESVPPGGEPTGFDVELTEAIAGQLGLTVEWRKQNFNTIFTAVSQGQFDMVAAAVTATGKVGRERAQTVDFSDFYYNSEQGFTVNTDKTPEIATVDDLKSGDVVGVQLGTTGEQWAKDNLAPNGVQIKGYTAAPQAFTDLEAGIVAGVINDAPSSAAEVEDRPGLEVVQQIDTNEKYAFAFSKDNTALVDAWNEGLKEVIADGTYATIFAKYFPGVQLPTEYQTA